MRLYIGNLPYDANEGSLEAWFAQMGVTVDEFTLMRDKFSGQSRGFGFAEIQDQARGEEAINLCNGQDFMGRQLVVNEARPQGGGGQGGGFGGGNDRRGKPPQRGRRQERRW